MFVLVWLFLINGLSHFLVQQSIPPFVAALLRDRAIPHSPQHCVTAVVVGGSVLPLLPSSLRLVGLPSQLSFP